jgi:hypothetical protein
VAVAHQLEMIANVEAAEHNARRAACLYGAAEALRKAYNYPIRPRDQAEYDAAVAIISEQLSPDDFNSSWMHGSAMPLTEVIDGIK